MEKDQEESRCCKVCSKVFTNGRSLGGHMRSHLSLDSPFDAGESAGYGLRENPKKSWRASDSSNDGNAESESQSESETRGAVSLRRRRKLKRVAAICDDSLIVPESDQEQEDGALILMMLSRGVSELGRKRRLYRFETETDGFDDCKKGRYKCRTCDKVFSSYQALGGHRASHNVNVVKRLKNKSKDHECPVCGRAFASGQALGGHKRSHWSGNSEANSIGFRFQAFNHEDYDDSNENPNPSHCLWI